MGESYRIKCLLGKGGMGNVYLAEHIIIGKQYALKMLAPEQVTEENWNRFQIEGKAIARMDHPNIVKVYNMGVDKTGVPFYVMDLLPGDSLQDLLKSGKVPDFDSLLSIFLQIASALEYSHSRGVIHRDVKPSNIMLVPRGQATGSKYGGVYEARLVDFGIAKMVDFSDVDKQRLTATGQVFGTPFYMSPEQCLGNSLDARSDIYSFGCTFFQALTGRPPFQGETALETVMMHLHEEPPTLKAAGAVYSSPELESLVAKLLLKDRERRYGSMGQVIHDLERILAQKPIAGAARSIGFESSPVRPAQKSQTDAVNSPENTSTSKASIGLIAAGGALLLLLLAVPCFLLFGPKSPPSEVAVPMEPLSNLMPDEAKIKNPERKVTDLASFVTADSSPASKKVLAYIASGSKVTFSLSKDGAEKIIHCPPFPVGKLRWCTTGSPRPRFDLEEGGRLAQGDVPVPPISGLFSLWTPLPIGWSGKSRRY
ncbi:MAG: serine/threonine protein kinase [Candidatus Competibacteraceae bacterium]|nr:serine/threonine protein kinase [Candidatus Competibacteraceae bacterium]